MGVYKNLRFEDDLTEAPIIFMHIPKTAGTSLIKVLEVNSPTVVRSENNYEMEKDIQRTGGVTGTDLFCGHIDLNCNIFTKHLPEYASITLLRDPIERVLSQIYYLKNTPGHMFYDEVKDLSIEEIFTSKKNLSIRYAVFDYQVHLLSGSYHWNAKGGTKFRKAAANLGEAFSFFGFTEEFDLFIEMCAIKFGWSDIPEVPVYNSSPKERNEMLKLTDSDLKLIQKNNKYDRLFYAEAKEMYEERFKIPLFGVEEDIEEVEIIEEEKEGWPSRFGRRLKSIVLFWRK